MSHEKPCIDRLYAQPLKDLSDFVFDDAVADVFSDMISRSVPGYETIIRMTGLLALQYSEAGNNFYDLGCSLGAASLAMSRGIDNPHARIVAVDNSLPMLLRARDQFDRHRPPTPIDLVCADISDVVIDQAAMVVLNFTLQFFPVEEREGLLRKLYLNLNPGGMLVLSEKIAFDDERLQQLFVAMHHQFKRDQGYSDLEISQKRTALEKVLIPETLKTHEDRLRRVGFSRISVWFQCFNFVSLIAVK